MKPIPVFEMDLWHAKKHLKCALQDILDRKDKLPFDDAQQLSWQLNNALGWLDKVQRDYNRLIKERNDETDGH